MKPHTGPIYSILLLTFLLGCGSQPEAAENGAYAGPVGDRPNSPGEARAEKVATVADEPIKYHEVLDSKTGMVQLRSPIPQSWQVHDQNAPIYITDPRGLKVHKSESFQFGWSPDPFMQQTIRMAGQTVAPPVSLQQILEQQIMPSARAQGYTFLGSFAAPGVEGFWQRYMAVLVDTGSQRSVEALGTEWRAATGTRSLIFLLKTVTQSPQSLFWQLTTTEMEAPPEHYEAAKRAYLYAGASSELNPQWVAASNQALARSIRQTQRYWDNASQISRQAHQQRMQSIADRGAAARSVGKTYSDILDISHQGYLTRDSINNQGHDRLVDSVAGTTVIGNHQTGEHYDVQAGSDHYWINADGLYLATDNANFDPRLHELTRDEQWTRFQQER